VFGWWECRKSKSCWSRRGSRGERRKDRCERTEVKTQLQTCRAV
jgi:hypothetical protein